LQLIVGSLRFIGQCVRLHKSEQRVAAQLIILSASAIRTVRGMPESRRIVVARESFPKSGGRSDFVTTVGISGNRATGEYSPLLFVEG
jgi:hypothetical protein